MFDEPQILALIVLMMMFALGTLYGGKTFSMAVNRRLRTEGDRAKGLAEAIENLGKSAQKFDGHLQKKLASLDGQLMKLAERIGDAKRDVLDLGKRSRKLTDRSSSALSKIDEVKQKVDKEIIDLKRIDGEAVESVDKSTNNARQIESLEHDVHSLELKRIDGQIKKINSNLGRVTTTTRHIDQIEHEVHALQSIDKVHELELRQIHAKITDTLGRVNGNARQIGHLGQEINGLDHRHLNGQVDYESRCRAISELQSADRKIQKLMDETIQIEAGCLGRYSTDRLGSPLAQEYEEHHRKLIDAAQHIFRDIRKFLSQPAVHAMEVEDEKVDWTRGELFSNTTSPEAAAAYHQQVKDYYIRLKEAVNRSVHDLAEYSNHNGK